MATRRHIVKTFVDNLRVYVKGGGGGHGLPKYGGIGGRGGHVYAVAKENATLKGIRSQFPTQRITAGKGEYSSGRALQGAAGVDVEIEVPPGVSIYLDNNAVLGEVNADGDRVLLARGGRGGLPENNFKGENGQAHNVMLDLKLIADIGLVGFPNAGKSTLLSALSRAKPKIASYPFTTIQPQLGIMKYDDHRQISIADLPGLIEGAHINIGMGHKFLKHIERTKLLLFVVDIYGFRLSANHEPRSAIENILLLNKELELYREDLVLKPAVLVLNKVDIDGSDNLLKSLAEQLANLKAVSETVEKEVRPTRLIQFDDIISISAKRRLNTDTLKLRLRQLLDLYADIEVQKQSNCDRQLSIDKSSIIEHYGQHGI